MDDLHETLEASRRSLLACVQGLSQADATRRPADEQWSVIEVLAHMIDVDRYYFGEALAMRDTPDYLFSYFDDEAWKREHPNVRETPLAEVQRSHTEVLMAVSDLTAAELARPGRHPRGIPYSVRDVLLRFPAHDENHAQQILALLASFVGPEV